VLFWGSVSYVLMTTTILAIMGSDAFSNEGSLDEIRHIFISFFELTVLLFLSSIGLLILGLFLLHSRTQQLKQNARSHLNN